MRLLAGAALALFAVWGCSGGDGGAAVAPSTSAVVPSEAGLDAGADVVEKPPSDAGNDASSSRDDAALSDPREAPGTFAAVGNHVRHIRSLDDGITWVDDATDIAASMTGDLYGIRSVTWGNGVFVAFAAKVLTSPDGKAWTEVTKPDGQWLASMLYAQGQWVSSGGYGWLATTTTDLGSWTQHPPRNDYTSAHHSQHALAFGKVKGSDAYVVVDDNGEIFHAQDGKTWLPSTGAPVVPSGNTWGTIFTFGDGVFVGVLPSGVDVVRSTDGGATWSTHMAAFGVPVAGVVHAQGHFTALASGHVFTSADGQSWIDQAEPSAQAGDLTYGHGTYLALSNNGNVYRSNDGLTWKLSFENKGNPDQPASIAFGPK